MLEKERHKREEFQQMKVRRTGGAEAHSGAGQERHKREEFQQRKVRRTGGAEAHAGAGETQERGVPADEGKEERCSRSSCWSRRDIRERSSSR